MSLGILFQYFEARTLKQSYRHVFSPVCLYELDHLTVVNIQPSVSGVSVSACFS